MATALLLATVTVVVAVAVAVTAQRVPDLTRRDSGDLFTLLGNLGVKGLSVGEADYYFHKSSFIWALNLDTGVKLSKVL